MAEGSRHAGHDRRGARRRASGCGRSRRSMKGRKSITALYLPVDWKPGGKLSGDRRIHRQQVSSGQGKRRGEGREPGLRHERRPGLHLGGHALRGEGTARRTPSPGGATGRRPSTTAKSTCRASANSSAATRTTSSSAAFPAVRSAPATSAWPTTRSRRCGKACSPTTTSTGSRKWGYPESDRASALKRLARLKGRPVLVCGTARLQRSAITS